MKTIPGVAVATSLLAATLGGCAEADSGMEEMVIAVFAARPHLARLLQKAEA